MSHFLQGSGPVAGMPGGPMPVVVADVVQKDITLLDEFSGRLTAVDDVQIRPRVAGMVDSVNFTDGQLVNKGDLLFVIDPRPYRAALKATQARYDLAETEFNRAELLIKDQAISQKDFDQRKNAYDVAKADLTQAQLNLGYTHVRAPITGKVGRREVAQGNLVAVGQPVLTTVVSQDPIYADFEADEQRFLKYLAKGTDSSGKAGAPVKLEVSSSSIGTREGKIHSFDNQLDVSSGTIRVRAVFDNADGALLPGMFARVMVTSGDSGPALLVADSAVGTDQSKKFVYIVNDKNVAEYREVTLGPAYERMRVIKTGLKEGETVIAKGIARIRPGTPLQPQKVSMEEAVAAHDPGADKKPEEPHA